MRLLFFFLALAGMAAACRTTLPGVPANERPPGEGEDRPPSSTERSCRKDEDCQMRERCYYFRLCSEDDPKNCPPPKGDLKCHKSCEDNPCPKGEQCREVPIAYGEHQTEARMCF